MKRVSVTRSNNCKWFVALLCWALASQDIHGYILLNCSILGRDVGCVFPVEISLLDIVGLLKQGGEETKTRPPMSLISGCRRRLWSHLPLFWTCPSKLFKAFSLPSCPSRLGGLVLQVLSDHLRLPTKMSFAAQSSMSLEAVFAFPRSFR